MPPQTQKTTAKDFFLYLSALITLYISFGALLTLLFNYINYLFPDILSDRYYYADPYSAAVRLSISLLLIIFPIFIGLAYFINKDLRAKAEKRDLWVRRSASYLTVFLAAAIVAGDLITLLNTFLNGEITTRFILKVLAVLVVAGLTLWYYILDIRGRIIESPRLAAVFRAVAIILVLGSIIGGFLAIGSPQTAREARFDQQKIADLQNIQWQIVSYWQTKQHFPKSLDELADPLSGFNVPKDSQTGEPYGFELGEGYAFKLCATFNKESETRKYPEPAYPVGVGGDGLGKGGIIVPEDQNWQHPAGRFCFGRVLDPERYPPIKR